MNRTTFVALAFTFGGGAISAAGAQSAHSDSAGALSAVERFHAALAGVQGSTGSELAELMVVSRTAAGWKIRAIHWSSRRRPAA